MQADQSVLSLRPGGGNRGRTSGPGFDSLAFGSLDLPALRPHGGPGAPSIAAFKMGYNQHHNNPLCLAIIILLPRSRCPLLI
ncbi:hypothetical protein L6452_37572 [Arctium lappa]|uniref:Uncharacterized protein n=1 Tax=Arctium lappa TaxID=4217 RepID=A0ACB8Y4D9_ARCLA|nr:hypothetical protein L6452_37572 [Arctium lappa]